MREKLEDNNVYFYYKDDIKNIIKGMWKLESTIMINTNLIIQALKFTESLFSNNKIEYTVKPCFILTSPIDRQTRISPWNYQVPFSFHVKNLFITPNSHIVILPGVKRSNGQFNVDCPRYNANQLCHT